MERYVAMRANSRRKWDIFIAHAGPDLDVAEQLFGYLSKRSRVFLDSKCLLPGDDWDQVLSQAQSDSDITVVLVSRHSDSAYYQREEIAAAIAQAREELHRVVPVYLRAPEMQRVPYGLRLKHGIHMKGPEDVGLVANRLLSLVDELHKTSDTPDRKPGQLIFISSGPIVPDDDESAIVRSAYNQGKWILLSKVAAQFSAHEFNTERYHRSLGRLTRADATKQGNQLAYTTYTGGDQRIVPFETERNSRKGGVSRSTPEPLMSKWQLEMYFGRCPDPTDTVRMQAGPIIWEVLIGNQEWLECHGETWDKKPATWWVSKAALDIEIPAVDWPIVSAARFLRGESNLHNILEITIENHSQDLLALSSLKLSATHHTPPAPSGITGPTWQKLELDWGRVKLLPRGVREVEAWTWLGDEKVRAEAAYRPGNVGGYNDEFRVELPVAASLEKGEIARLAVKILETVPGLTSYSRYSSLRRSHDADDYFELREHSSHMPLSEYDEISVSCSADQVIYPQWYPIKK
jgi:hypothetical protein